MGSYASGRYRTRNRGAVESAIRLDLVRLRELGVVVPGARRSASIRWSNDGRETHSIGLTVDLSPGQTHFAKLNFSVNGEAREQVISIESDPCRFGGRRYFFCCPRTCDRVVALHCVGGFFASRAAHRLTYRSQSEDAFGRLCRQRAKAEARVLRTDGRPRPRGANRERLIARWIAYEEAADSALVAHFAGRFARHGLTLDDM